MFTAFTPARHGERRIADSSKNKGKVKIIVSSWLRLAMVRGSESETDNIVIGVVDRMYLGMAEKKGFVVEDKESHHPDEMIKRPDRNARPNVGLEFPIPDDDVT